MDICTMCQLDHDPTQGETPHLCEVHQSGPPAPEPRLANPDVPSAREPKASLPLKAIWIQSRLFDMPNDSKH